MVVIFRLFLSVQRLHAFARSLHTFNRSKKMNCKLPCKAVYPSMASKALVMDQYSPVSNPIKHKINKKGRQTNKTHQNQIRHREVGSLPALRNEMHDDILCVITSMPEKEAKQRQPGKHQGPYKRVKEATKLNAETGDPPARIPEITESSHSGITFTQALRSKQRRRRVATRVVRTKKGQTGGET